MGEAEEINLFNGLAENKTLTDLTLGLVFSFFVFASKPWFFDCMTVNADYGENAVKALCGALIRNTILTELTICLLVFFFILLINMRIMFFLENLKWDAHSRKMLLNTFVRQWCLITQSRPSNLVAI